mgnify:FL=1
MAEEKKGKRQQKLIQGINRDLNPIDQIPGTYRYALNATTGRDIGAISNEAGTINYVDLPSALEVIGSVVVYDLASQTKFVIFSVSDTGVSEIGKIGLDHMYTTLVNDVASIEKFNFSSGFPIEGEYKINSTGEVSIYWTDDKNVPRYMNLSNIPTSPYNLDLFNLFPQIKSYPIVLLDNIMSNGGALKLGTYQLAVAYMTEDGAVTSYLEIGNPIYINDENESAAMEPTNSWGGANLLSDGVYNGGAGGIGTSKAIRWSVRELDLDYKFIQPCIIRVVDNIQDAITLDKVQINTAVGGLTYVYFTGLEQSASEIIGAVQVPKEAYTKAKSVAQVDDVLYWGNLEKNRTDIGYQKYANHIKIHKAQVNPDHNADTGTTSIWHLIYDTGIPMDRFALKSNRYASTLKGYKRGEVYAFYITWVMKDGTESVAYHIPGRRATPTWRWYVDGIWTANGGMYENELVTTQTQSTGGDDHSWMSQIPHLGSQSLFYFTDTYAGTNYTIGNRRGFGYWENQTETYPDLANDVDIDGNYAGNFEEWKVDTFGNGNQVPGSIDLHGEKVRHHHFPTNAAFAESGFMGNSVDFNTQQLQTVNPLGIRINDVPIPAEVIELCVAYKIYYLEKTTNEKVCVDYAPIQGGRENGGKHFDNFGSAWLAFPHQWLDDQYIAGPTGGLSEVPTPFFTALPLDSMLSGDTIDSIDWVQFEDTEYAINGDGFSIWQQSSDGVTFGNRQNETHLSYDFCKHNLWGVGNMKRTFALRAKTRVPGGSIMQPSGFTNPVDNENGTECIAFEMYDSWGFDNWYHNNGSVQDIYRDSASSTNEINKVAVYYHSHANFHSFKLNVHLGFNNQTQFVYTGYAQNIIDPGGGLGYMHNPNSTGDWFGEGDICMGGDTYIGYYSYDRYRKSTRYTTYPAGGSTQYHQHILGGGAPMSHDEMFSPSSVMLINNSKIWDYAVYVFMTESRHNPYMRHTDSDDTAYYPSYPASHSLLMDHEAPTKKLATYNLDFNKLNMTRIVQAFDKDEPLQSFTDFPTRIIRSIKYNQSGLRDNFRVYLPEDYRDLPRHRGELWKVKSWNNVVVPHMERAMYLTKGKETLQVSDASEAFLGTGDLFEKDPAEILLTDRGYGGSGSQWGAVSSEFGYFFADKDAGKIFLMGEKLEEISSHGLKHFFAEHLQTGKELTQYGLPYNYDNPIKRIGIIATYDPSLKRFILTKKDLKPNPNSDWSTVSYDPETRWFSDSGAQVTLEHFLRHKEWTASYDPQSKAWVSFHSYKPVHYLAGLKRFYSVEGRSYNFGVPQHELGNNLWEHQSPVENLIYQTPGRFYNTNYGFMVDYIDNEGPELTKTYKSITWVATHIDVISGSYMDLPFNPPVSSFQVYNSRQLSAVIPYAEGVNGRKTERSWYFNGFRDDVDYSVLNNPPSNEPMVNNYVDPGSWPDTSSIGAGFAEDWLPGFNTDYLSATKQWHERGKFTDKWLGIRYYYSNIQNNFVSLYSVDAYKKISYR